MFSSSKTFSHVTTVTTSTATKGMATRDSDTEGPSQTVRNPLNTLRQARSVCYANLVATKAHETICSR